MATIIDERVVSMAFQNAAFEAGIAQTMRSLAKLDSVLSTIGSRNSLGDIEKAANKVTLQQPMSALDKLRARFSRAGEGATGGFNEIERAGNKVQLAEPIRALNKVQSAVGNVGAQASDGFNQIEKSANRVSLAGVTSAVSGAINQFNLLEIAAGTALGNMATKAAASGKRIAGTFSFGPIKQGMEEYQTNLQSIQTIMANTEGQRVSGLGATNKALQELNTYADQTIYNFSQMAKNIGTFTAAGVDLPKATASIKGIANLAALSGSSAQQASTAMYQLSQGIAAGRISLQDWNSVVNAGMGGAKFQKALMQTAENMGALEKGAVKIDKATGKATVNGQSFRESIMAKPGQTSWLSDTVLTDTLAQFTGDMSDAELKAKGFTDAQVKSIQATAKAAKEAATQVKTLPQLMDVTREAIGSGWALTFQHIFGDFAQAKKLFTGMSQTINGFIGKNADARNKVLKEWNTGGGRAAVIEGLKNAFKGLFALLKPIGQAFRDVFPKKTGQDLIEMSKNFQKFTEKLKPSAQTMDGLRRTARGFFAVLHIGWAIVKGVVGVFGDLLGILGKGSGGFLGFTGGIGDFLVAVDNALTKGGLLESFFKGLSSVLQLPFKLLTGIASAIGSLFGGVSSGAGDEVSGSMDSVRGAAGPLAGVLDRLKEAWDGFVRILGQAKELVSPWLDRIGDSMGTVASKIGEAFQGENFDKTMTMLQTGFIGGIFLAIKKAIGRAGNEFVGILNPVNKVLNGVTGNLTAMQNNLKAQTLFLIAAAIGVLAASTLALSKIDAQGLQRAMTAIAVGLGQLVAAMVILAKVAKGGAFITMPILSASLVLLAGSLVILAGAMKIFATMSWEELAKGLAGVGGGLVAIAIGMKVMGKGTIVQALPILVLSIALNALAAAVKQFSDLDWEELGRGLAGVLGALVAIIGPLSQAGPMVALGALALIPMALGMSMLAGAVKAFAEMDWEEMVRGITGAMLALIGIGAAMHAFPPSALLIGPGLLLVAIGLTAMAGAVKAFGSMSIGEMAKGLVAIGLSLGILAVGLTAMMLTLPGAAALLIAAGAFALLAPTLAFLGTLSWGTIFKGLASVVLILGTLALAGQVTAPGLVILGLALLPLGLAFTLVATAAYLFAVALEKATHSGTKGVGILIAAITAFIAVLPKFIISLLKGLTEILGEVVILAPQIVAALVKITEQLLDAIIKLTPKLTEAFGKLVTHIATVIARDSPRLIQAGFTLILNLLKGLDQNIGEITKRAASAIIKFMEALTSKAPELTRAGAKMIIAFLKGIGDHIREVTKYAHRIVLKVLAETALLPAKMAGIGGRSIIAFLNAIGKQIPDVITAAIKMSSKFLKGFARGLVKLSRVAADALIIFLNGFAQAIRDKAPEIRKAGWNVIDAIVDGMLGGLKDLWGKVEDKLKSLADKIPGPIKKALKILSPSRVMWEVGKNVVLGLAIGIGDNSPKVMAAMAKLGVHVKNGFAVGVVNMADVIATSLKPLSALVKANKSAKELGEFLGKQFQEGLTGGIYDHNAGKTSAEIQIEDTFKSLGDKFTEEQDKLREKVKQDRQTLDDLLAEDQPNAKKVQKAYAALLNDTVALASSISASSRLMTSLQGQKNQLTALAQEFDLVTRQLEKAQEVFNQFDVLPDFNKLVDEAVAEAALTGSEKWDKIRKEQEEKDARNRIDQVALYRKSLQEQVTATTKYMETLQKLREAGLDDQTYQKLLDQGTAGQEFASQLLRSGPTGIAAINELDAKLAAASSKLAENAAKALVTAGDQAAQGLITGLQTRRDEIRKTMEDIAGTMIAAIKKQLGIKSPSQAFAEIGTFSVKGLAQGLTASSSLVQDAAASVGDDAAEALTESLAGISERVQNGINTDVTITPVLDLSQVQKDASKIDDLSNVVPITAAASYGQASAISEEAKAAAEAQASAQPTIEVNLEQNNTSPKALDDVEIYRQTNNQLSKVKGALGLVS